MSNISRRDFLKGVAAAAVSTAAVGIVGASAAADEGQASVSSTTEYGFFPEVDWLGKMPVAAESEISSVVSADVVVVGGGNAGVCAALAAAEGGASVAVIEQQPEGNYTNFGHDIGTVNCKFTIEHGGEEIDPVEFLRDWQRRNANMTNARLVRKYAFHSGECLDWLLGHLSDDVKNNIGVFGNPYPKNYPGEISGFKSWAGAIHFQGEGTDWPDAAKQLIAASKEAGAEWYFGTSAVAPIMDGKRVGAILAKDADGNYIKFEAAKAVILSAGDYGGNIDMLFALNDQYRHWVEARGQDVSEMRAMSRKGDGHKIGIWAGGMMEANRAGMAHANGAAAFGGLAMLALDRDCRRFMDEGMLGVWGSYMNLMRLPVGNLYYVIDSKWREFVEYNALEHVYPGTGGFNDGGFLGTLEEIIPTVVDAGAEGVKIRGKMTYGAQTLEELADYLGLDEEKKANFLAEIARYNELCEKGLDEDFAKDSFLMLPISEPPYYVSVDDNKAFSTGLVELSGLITDENMNVLDRNSDPIPGLYAIGNCCGGRYSNIYQTPLAGNSLGWATSMGKMVGDIVAAL